jgi:hypothetical protein
MRDWPQADIAKDERERRGGVTRKFSHARIISTGKVASLNPAAPTFV